MRVMSYNILEGANLTGGDRTELVLDTIRSAKPDIIGLCECTDFDKHKHERFNAFCRQLGMAGTMNHAASGHHVALLYREGKSLKFVSSSNSCVTMYNGLVRVTFENRRVGRFTVLMTHLHPFSSWLRVTEAQILVGRARSAKEAIIMGDFNSLSAADLPLDLTAASPSLATRLLGPTCQVDTEAVSLLHNHGFVDLGRRSMPPVRTYPTTLGGKRERYGMMVRLDYCFATEGLAGICRAFTVDESERAHSASDHLPVSADFAC